MLERLREDRLAEVTGDRVVGRTRVGVRAHLRADELPNPLLELLVPVQPEPIGEADDGRWADTETRRHLVHGREGEELRVLDNRLGDPLLGLGQVVIALAKIGDDVVVGHRGRLPLCVRGHRRAVPRQLGAHRSAGPVRRADAADRMPDSYRATCRDTLDRSPA